MGRLEACTGFWWEKLRERYHWGDSDGDEGYYYDRSSRSRVWGMDWFELAQDRDRCRALLNEVMNLRVPSNAGIT
jgi:hypothetical protein